VIADGGSGGNGLVVAPGWDDFGNGVYTEDVTFTDHGGGSWSIALDGGSGGTVSFSSAEIDTINLFGDANSSILAYSWDGEDYVQV
jgi:hypothetical protein